uniref:Uncharacterized protein n=1 Tax=Meloidogyne javanica TaxID=6303 RepID=A0A915LQ68_MELJA
MDNIHEEEEENNDLTDHTTEKNEEVQQQKNDHITNTNLIYEKEIYLLIQQINLMNKKFQLIENKEGVKEKKKKNKGKAKFDEPKDQGWVPAWFPAWSTHKNVYFQLYNYHNSKLHLLYH